MRKRMKITKDSNDCWGIDDPSGKLNILGKPFNIGYVQTFEMRGELKYKAYVCGKLGSVKQSGLYPMSVSADSLDEVMDKFTERFESGNWIPRIS